MGLGPFSEYTLGWYGSKVVLAWKPLNALTNRAVSGDSRNCARLFRRTMLNFRNEGPGNPGLTSSAYVALQLVWYFSRLSCPPVFSVQDTALRVYMNSHILCAYTKCGENIGQQYEWPYSGLIVAPFCVDHAWGVQVLYSNFSFRWAVYREDASSFSLTDINHPVRSQQSSITKPSSSTEVKWGILTNRVGSLPPRQVRLPSLHALDLFTHDEHRLNTSFSCSSSRPLVHRPFQIMEE